MTDAVSLRTRASSQQSTLPVGEPLYMTKGLPSTAFAGNHRGNRKTLPCAIFQFG